MLLPNDLDEDTAKIERGSLPILEDVDLRLESYYNSQNFVTIYSRLHEAHMPGKEITPSAPFDPGQKGHPNNRETRNQIPSSIPDVVAANNALAAKFAKTHGVVFRQVPPELQPGMAYTVTDDLIDDGATQYSPSQISRIVRDGEIGAIQFEGKNLITPKGAEQLFAREDASRSGQLAVKDRNRGSGKRPGPRTQRSARRKRARALWFPANSGSTT
jgi:hypothetical protein